MNTQVGQTKMMSESAICIGDVHGAFLTLQSLLSKHPGHRVILLGDLIDRGPRSREVVEWAIVNNIETVRANHDDLCLAYSPHYDLGYRAKCASLYDQDVWLWNGGDKALKSWGNPEHLPRAALDWMSNLPPYIILDQESEGRKGLISHTGYGLDADKRNWHRALWGRFPDDGEFVYEKDTGKEIDDGYYRIFGHNRGRVPEVTSTYAMVDTGAAYPGYGKLTAMIWPSREIVQVDYCD